MYINSYCSISPAGVLLPEAGTASLQRPSGERASCIEPGYTDLIPPMQLRRMTKPVRIGIAAARLCLKHTGTEMPGSIHVGTAYGMLDDSEQFLRKMTEQDEQMLTPTAFIQSTHNTVAGQIALSLGCNAHNMTFVHKAHSFESALLDAVLMTQEREPVQVLAGAVDECTDTSFALLKRFGVYHAGNTAGEGAAFFLLSACRQPGSLAYIKAFDMFTAPGEKQAEERIAAFLEKEYSQPAAGDLVLDGTDMPLTGLFGDCRRMPYKSYCGSFPTDTGFALALATALLQEGSTKGRCYILNRQGSHYACWCIEKV